MPVRWYSSASLTRHSPSLPISDAEDSDKWREKDKGTARVNSARAA